MTNETSLSYSFSAETPGAPADALYAFADCDFVPIDGNMMLVINRCNGRQQIIAPQVVEALKTCTVFRTLDAHAERLARTRADLKGNKALAHSALEQLRANDMLLAASTIRERLDQHGEGKPAPTRVFIITCDRPAAVERLLESLLRVGNLTRHDALFLIDDSREAGNRHANREAVERFNLRSAKNLTYFGAEEQQALQQRLIGELPEHEAGIRFLIDPAQWTGRKTYGRSRTLGLLLSIGYRAIIMDDDILCEAVLPPIPAEKGIGFTGERKAAFFPNREALAASRHPTGEDPLTGHARHLGEPLGAALKALNGAPLDETQLAGCNAAMLNVLDPDAPVLVTQCGSWGDPGTESTHWAVSLGEDSIERLVNAPHGMAAALENRLNWLGCARPSLHKMPLMSQMTGLDNSCLLPPYFPAFRGEDLLFGTLLEALHHRGAVIEYPWSVPHLPVDERPGYSIRSPMVGAGGVKLFSRYLAANIDYRDASDPAVRLRHIADDARRLAARSDEDLLVDYRLEQGRHLADSLARLRAQYSRAQELPSMNWQGYLKRGVEEVSASLQKPQSPLAMHGLPADMTEAGLCGEFRALAEGWAAALEAWPAMRNAQQAP